LGTVVGLIWTGALSASVAVGSVSPITNPATIQKLAEHAYVWGSPPEFVYRFANYNELVTARKTARELTAAVAVRTSG
jgi:hypothetical protein